MVNRKRYYNSFFDQINNYKKHETGEREASFFVHHHVLGVGLFGALLIGTLSVGGLQLSRFTPTTEVGGVAFVKSESRPAFQFFNQLQSADQSFARELDGLKVWPIADAYTSNELKQTNFGRTVLLVSGGKGQGRAFLRFDVSSLAKKNDTVLKLYPAKSFRGSIQVAALPSDELWEEDVLTAESAPIAKGTVLAKADGLFNQGQSVDFDLKDAIVNQAVVTFVVSAVGDADGFAFYAHEHSQGPELVGLN